MKRIVLSCVVLIMLGGLAAAMQTMGEQIQQMAAGAKEAAARNQQALRAYSWNTKTELSVKGEVKNTKIESCKYGPDGKVQKTLLTDPPPPPEKQRGLKGRMIAKKTAEMQETLEASAALVQRYVPPAAEKLQAVIAAGKVSISQAGPGVVALRFPCQPTTAFENAKCIMEYGRLVGRKIDHAIRQDHVYGSIGDRKVFNLSQAKRYVGILALLGVLPGFVDHLRRHVHTDHSPAFPHLAGRQKTVEPSAAAEV